MDFSARLVWHRMNSMESRFQESLRLNYYSFDFNAKRFLTVFLCFGSELTHSDLDHQPMILPTLIGQCEDPRFSTSF